MGEGYEEGVDGDLTYPESMELYKCEKGDTKIIYSRDMCCPSRSWHCVK
jgi:hypothetical protein